MIMIYLRLAHVDRKSRQWDEGHALSSAGSPAGQSQPADVSSNPKSSENPSSSDKIIDGEQPTSGNEINPVEEQPSSKAASSTRSSSFLSGSSRKSVAKRNKRKIQSLKNQFATQALLYCLAYFFTWVFNWINFLLISRKDRPPYFPIKFLDAFFAPLQGFWNACIYLRPRWIRHRQEQKRSREQHLLHGVETPSS